MKNARLNSESETWIRGMPHAPLLHSLTQIWNSLAG